MWSKVHGYICSIPLEGWWGHHPLPWWFDYEKKYEKIWKVQCLRSYFRPPSPPPPALGATQWGPSQMVTLPRLGVNWNINEYNPKCYHANMIFDSVFEVDSVLEYKSDFQELPNPFWTKRSEIYGLIGCGSSLTPLNKLNKFKYWIKWKLYLEVWMPLCKK